MNTKELKAEMVRHGYTMAKLAEVIGIKKTSMYRKMHGKTQFKQREMCIIKNSLGLTSEKLEQIFFSELVS